MRTSVDSSNAQVAMKPVLTNFMRRLDKTLTKIHKNQRIYVSTDWSAVSTLLRGLYQVSVEKYLTPMNNMTRPSGSILT